MKEVLVNLPTPLELVLNPISYITFGMYGGLMLLGSVFPARKLPWIKRWKLRGMSAFILFFYLSSYLPILWGAYLAKYQVFDLTSLGTIWGAIAGIMLYDLVGLMLYELGVYIRYRTRHSSTILWKMFHQKHPNVERLNSYGVFHFSPMDIIGFTFLGSLFLVVIAGFNPEATTLIILGTTFLSIFPHGNIKNQVWSRYIIGVW
ncbi:MAG: sterol desaturase family protein [Saonia sp.]